MLAEVIFPFAASLFRRGRFFSLLLLPTHTFSVFLFIFASFSRNFSTFLVSFPVTASYNQLSLILLENIN